MGEMRRTPKEAPVPVHEKGEAPVFSVIIPTYGDGPLVQRAVESVLDQRFRDFEVLVVDDAGDPPAELGPHESVNLLRRPVNGGAGAARNTGLKAARGEWAAFLDADDIWFPERLGAFAEVLAKGTIGPGDALTTDLEVHDTDGSVSLYSEHRPFKKTDQAYHQIRRPFLTALFAARRQHLLDLGGFNEELRNGEDSELLLRLIFAGGTVHYIDRPLARYYRGTGKSSGQRRLWTSQITQLEMLLALDLSDNERTAALKRLEYVKEQLGTAIVNQVREDLLRGEGRREDILKALSARSARGGTRLLFTLGLVSPRLAQMAGRVVAPERSA